MLIDMNMNEVDSMSIRIVIEMPSVMDIIRFLAQYDLDSIGETHNWRLDTSWLHRTGSNRGAILDVWLTMPYSKNIPMIATMEEEVWEHERASMMVYVAEEQDDPAHAIAGWTYFDIDASRSLMHAL